MFGCHFSRVIKQSKILFPFLRVIGLFLRSKAPGLVFSEEKDSGLPPVTSEKSHDPRILAIPCKQLDATGINAVFNSNRTCTIREGPIWLFWTHLLETDWRNVGPLRSLQKNEKRLFCPDYTKEGSKCRLLTR